MRTHTPASRRNMRRARTEMHAALRHLISVDRGLSKHSEKFKADGQNYFAGKVDELRERINNSADYLQIAIKKLDEKESF